MAGRRARGGRRLGEGVPGQCGGEEGWEKPGGGVLSPARPGSGTGVVREEVLGLCVVTMRFCRAHGETIVASRPRWGDSLPMAHNLEQYCQQVLVTT